MTSERDQLDVLRRDPAGWPAAVGELVRTNGPVHIARIRYAAEDMEIGGITVRQGEGIMPVLVTANRDPRVYDGPEHLDVTRRPAGRGDGHVGFGHGPHYCLGAALARQEGEVALRALFDRYPDIRFAGDEPKWLQLPGCPAAHGAAGAAGVGPRGWGCRKATFTPNRWRESGFRCNAPWAPLSTTSAGPACAARRSSGSSRGSPGRCGRCGRRR